MKKLIITFIALLIIFLTNNLTAQQLYGKWIVPTDYLGYKITNELAFTENGITLNSSLLPALFSPQEFSAGGFNANYDLEFYVLGETFCYDNTSYDWITTPSPYMQPEFQIIKKPGSGNEYFSFFTGDNISARDTDFHFSYNEIEVIGNTVQQSDEIGIRSGLNDYIAFAITEIEDGNYTLFTATTRSATTDPTIYLAGLRKWTISSTGVGAANIILSEEDNLDYDDFDAYNLEHKKFYNGNDYVDVIAWIHGVDNSGNSMYVTELIVVNDGNPQKFTLNNGRLAGIEFSTFEDNMIYVSSANGLLKVNYNTGQVIETVFLGDYQRTFLQTAPDGNIYAVSNSGNTLGQIDMQDGSFTHNYFSFPQYHQVSSTENLTGNDLYYILPENSRTWVPLEAEAEAVGVLCPGYTNGEVTIYVSGGAPFEPPADPYNIICTSHPSVTFTWDEDLEAFIATGLGEDTYYYEITDQYGNFVQYLFIIELDNNGFSHPEHKTYSSSNTWDGYAESFAYGFTINNNSQITVINSTLQFGDLGKIIIEPGSELIIDNSTLTYYPQCGPWQGIEVWGNSNKSQLIGAYGIMYQGKLTVKNNSFIKNAWNAVTTQNPDNFNSHGGIIMAENSTFENNKRSVEVMQYENFNPYNSDIKLPYISKIKNCTLVINDSYIIPSEMYAHVSLWDVYGIQFTGCKFRNDNTTAQNTGYGIFTLNAGYSLLNYCSSSSQPCPVNDVVYNEFHNLYEGIHAGNTEFCTNRPYVNDAKFYNNSTGVYLAYVKNAIVINCDFEIAPNYRNVPNCGDEISGFGIDALESSGFIFENNKFLKHDSGVPDKYYTGIHVKDCPSDHDIIYNNEYTDLSFGNYAEGMNRGYIHDDLKGVEYRCNENTDNALDFIVAADEQEDARIRNYQGLPEIASGNTFSQSQETIGHFINLGLEVVDYYYYSDDPLQVPGAPPLITSEYVNPTGYNIPENQCPDHYGGGGSIKLSSAERLNKETDYANSLVDYNSVLSLYESYTDGGNTTSELLDIETAIPDDMWALRSQLLGDSPYLSQEVLMNMSDRTDVFPDDAIFDILAANPDELKEDTLISFLENKEDPLPDYMISILKQLSLTNTTYKTVLLNDMAKYSGNKTQAAKSIIHSILADSIIDQSDLRGWLGNLESIEADKQVVSSYLMEKDSANAIALLNIIPTFYELDGIELDEFNDYIDLLLTQLGWNNNGKTIYNLDSTDIALLEFYADNTSGDASITAKNILSFAYGYFYCNCLSYTDSLYYKSDSYNSNKLNYNDAISIGTSPNPASLWVAFDYKLISDNSVGKIMVTNISGNLVAEFEVTCKQGQQLWDTRAVAPGVYIYTLLLEGFSTSGKMVIK